MKTIFQGNPSTEPTRNPVTLHWLPSVDARVLRHRGMVDFLCLGISAAGTGFPNQAYGCYDCIMAVKPNHIARDIQSY
jgi:hypothetical protein